MNGPGDAMLGLTCGEVRLVPSDRAWPAAFERLAAELWATLGDMAVAVEHIGSTAVPALKHRLATQFPDDRGAYTAGKAAFVAQLLAEEMPAR